MIYEGSCDTEDWSNDAKNAALLNGSQYNRFYCITDWIMQSCWAYHFFQNIKKQINF